MRMRSATIAVACFSILLTSPAVLADPKPTATEVIIGALRPLPFDLKGYLRRPTGAGRLPAAVLLPGCDQLLGPVDQDWGEKISSWGYVALTLDSFSSRGIKNTCAQRAPLTLAADAYQALAFLSRQTFIDAKNVFLVGFSQGGTLTLFAVERGGIELSSKFKFRAAVAFYPFCESSTGRLTVPTLIVIGDLDTVTPADACRKLAEGRDDIGRSRVKDESADIRLTVLPNAYHAFDVRDAATLPKPMGHHYEFNRNATDQSSKLLREFIRSIIANTGSP